MDLKTWNAIIDEMENGETDTYHVKVLLVTGDEITGAWSYVRNKEGQYREAIQVDAQAGYAPRFIPLGEIAAVAGPISPMNNGTEDEWGTTCS